ncbi:hypothetical protein GCM10009754_21950 [Amycolatopsis minnesotensis]|uniref:Uncharacterized protein n=1 Tax=Amycolatopsis minnesotensis TaxID=337894 RepID=A0ABN2QHH0_9PSEU
MTGGYPSATSTGKVTSVPDPTTALMVPAHTPASPISTACHHVTLRTLSTVDTSRVAVVVGQTEFAEPGPGFAKTAFEQRRGAGTPLFGPV